MYKYDTFRSYLILIEKATAVVSGFVIILIWKCPGCLVVSARIRSGLNVRPIAAKVSHGGCQTTMRSARCATRRDCVLWNRVNLWMNERTLPSMKKMLEMIRKYIKIYINLFTANQQIVVQLMIDFSSSALFLHSKSCGLCSFGRSPDVGLMGYWKRYDWWWKL